MPASMLCTLSLKACSTIWNQNSFSLLVGVLVRGRVRRRRTQIMQVAINKKLKKNKLTYYTYELFRVKPYNSSPSNAAVAIPVVQPWGATKAGSQLLISPQESSVHRSLATALLPQAVTMSEPRKSFATPKWKYGFLLHTAKKLQKAWRSSSVRPLITQLDLERTYS
jgi:hypothetical protein